MTIAAIQLLELRPALALAVLAALWLWETAAPFFRFSGDGRVRHGAWNFAFRLKVRHSRWRPETDSNHSARLSFRDRLLRSFRHHEDRQKIRLGLDEFDASKVQSLAGMLATPLDPDRSGK